MESSFEQIMFIWTITTHYNGQDSPMLHTKFRVNLVLEKNIFANLTVYGHGGHLGHVTSRLINFHFQVLLSLHSEYG